MRFLILSFVMLFCMPNVTLAVSGDDVAPGTACSNEDAVMMTANPSGSGGYVLTCESGTWKATLSGETPTANEHLATKAYVDSAAGSGGGNGFTVNSTGCVNNAEVKLFWNASEGEPEYSCLDNTPNAFAFADQTEVAGVSSILSNILQLTGLSTAAVVTISGDGSPEFRICNDASCAIVDHGWGNSNQSLDNGQYLQLRLTTPLDNGVTLSASVAVGASSDQWDVTTKACASMGSVCADGSVHAGTTPATGGVFYATPVDDTAQNQQYGTDGSNTGATSVNDGQANTAALSIYANAQAALVCHNLTAYSRNDWYLPAENELNVLYTNRVAIGGFSSTYYISSTQAGPNDMRRQNFSNGQMETKPKTTSSYTVRCVRRD